jgi:anti-sigma B factor antagonist
MQNADQHLHDKHNAQKNVRVSRMGVSRPYAEPQQQEHGCRDPERHNRHGLQSHVDTLRFSAERILNARLMFNESTAIGSGPQIHTVVTSHLLIIGRMTSPKVESATIQVTTSQADGVTVLTVEGPLTINTLFKFQDAWRAEKSDVLILDLTAVPYADSAAIGSIVNAYVSRRNSNRMMAVAAGDRVRTTMQVTKVDQLFPLCSSREEALAALKR